MFHKLWRRLRRSENSPAEQAEDQAARRRAQQELQEAERRMLEERQRLDSAGGRGAPPGGMSGWG